MFQNKIYTVLTAHVRESMRIKKCVVIKIPITTKIPTLNLMFQHGVAF